MKSRFLLLIIYAAPTFLLASISSTMFVAAVAGGVWLWVAGDQPWPGPVVLALEALWAASFLSIWAALMFLALSRERHAETARQAGQHVVIAVGVTALLIFLAIAHQMSVGNIGSMSPETQCSAWCADRGFAASGISPRNTRGARACECLDQDGSATISRSID